MRLVRAAAVVGALVGVGLLVRRLLADDDVLPAIGGDTWPPVPTKDAPGRA